MKAEPLRQTVRTLYESGKRKKEIARFLKIDIKTVRSILEAHGWRIEVHSAANQGLSFTIRVALGDANPGAGGGGG